MNVSSTKRSAEESFYELSFYTLAHPDKEYFIHQHIVDAYQAQTANSQTKPISLIFSLVGLYLYVEKGYSGKAVQKAHEQLAQRKDVSWPEPELPVNRGSIDVSTVLKAEAGESRDRMIKEWCLEAWGAYKHSQTSISEMLDKYL